MILQRNKSLSDFNTFRIAAAAKYFCQFSSVNELRELLDNKELKVESKLILGGGSNILLTKDFNGAVLKNELKGIKIIEETNDVVFVKAGAGENWHGLVLFAIENNLAGIENLSLIPGNTGAGPMQNIGAYGVELKDVFHRLEAMEIATGEVHEFTNQDCEFGYRESFFKRKGKNRYVILNVTLKLSRTPRYNISYGAIQNELEKMNISELSLKAISDAVIHIRRSKLPDPAQIGNAGSFFKNPVINKELFEKIKIANSDIPAYPSEEGKIKTAAGWLIEKCGWKGFRKGDYGVHKDQALVLVNYGNATGEQIYSLSEEIIQSVKEKFGITLEREVNIL